MSKNMSLEEIIRALPCVLQNKIFYYITLHPAAEAFTNDFKYIENHLNENHLNIYVYKLFKFKHIQCRTWIKQDIKPFIVVDKILKEKQDKIYTYYNENNNLISCNRCYRVPIFNKIDIYCIKCIKEIEYMHSLIIPSAFIISYKQTNQTFTFKFLNIGERKKVRDFIMSICFENPKLIELFNSHFVVTYKLFTIINNLFATIYKLIVKINLF